MHVSSVLQALAKASKKKLEEEEGLDYDEVVRKTGVFFRAGDLDSAEEVRSRSHPSFQSAVLSQSTLLAVQSLHLPFIFDLYRLLKGRATFSIFT